MPDNEEKKERKTEDISLRKLLGGQIIIDSPFEEILEREIKKFGNTSAHIIVPKKHIGRKAQVSVYKKIKGGKK